MKRAGQSGMKGQGSLWIEIQPRRASGSLSKSWDGVRGRASVVVCAGYPLHFACFRFGSSGRHATSGRVITLIWAA